MNPKTNADGGPKAQYIETIFWESGIDSRVILPITDPYVVHHGALGSYGTVYLQDYEVDQASRILKELEGIEVVLTNSEASERFNLPSNRIGELVVLSDKDTVRGRTEDWHDLDNVKSGLRSHGGLHESIVPMMFNHTLTPEYQTRLDSGQAHNFEIFDFLCNGTISPK